MISSHVRLYGDDLTYYQFGRNGFDYFMLHHGNHYLEANGRALVHFILTLLLILPPIIWRVLTALCLTHMTWMALEILTHRVNRSRDRIWTYLFVLLIVASVDPLMASQSVFWTTGSLNYLFPMWAFFGFVHGQLSGKSMGWQIVFCFLSAFSVEQGSMMLFGFLVLNLMTQGLGPKESRKIRLLIDLKKNYLFFIISVIGLCSIMLAPSMLLRVSIEENASMVFSELIHMNVITLGTTFFFTRIMLPISLFLWLSLFAFIGDQVRKGHHFSKKDMGAFILWVCSVIYAGYYYYQYIHAAHLQDIQRFSSLPMVLLFITFIYIILRVGVLQVKSDSGSTGVEVMILLILALGSLTMMLISPVFGFRNYLFAYFLMPLYGLYIIPKNMQSASILVYSVIILIFKSQFTGLLILLSIVLLYYVVVRHVPYMKKWGYGLMLCLALVACTIMLLELNKGYRINAVVYDQNIQRIVVARITGEPFVQKKLPIYAYRWVMPYENPTYLPNYKKYMGLSPYDTLTWEE
jgi:hypothetical protein